MSQPSHTLVYAPQCPNCTRFMGALDRTPAKSMIRKVDVNTLGPDQRKHVTAVPMLVLSTGTTLVGTRAFEWLKDYEAQVEVDSFSPGRGLAFSDIADNAATMRFWTPYSAFEPPT